MPNELLDPAENLLRRLDVNQVTRESEGCAQDDKNGADQRHAVGDQAGEVAPQMHLAMDDTGDKQGVHRGE